MKVEMELANANKPGTGKDTAVDDAVTAN